MRVAVGREYFDEHANRWAIIEKMNDGFFRAISRGPLCPGRVEYFDSCGAAAGLFDIRLAATADGMPFGKEDPDHSLNILGTNLSRLAVYAVTAAPIVLLVTLARPGIISRAIAAAAGFLAAFFIQGFL